MNYILLGFSLASTLMILFSNILNFFEKNLPTVFSQTIRYGKFASKEKSKRFSKFLIEIPKACFKHFYVVALNCYAVVFAMVTAVYLLKYEVPWWVVELIDLVGGEERVSFVTPTQTYVVICLMSLQVIRRFYDTHFVSIFGKHSYINIHQYFVGIVYYPATALAILCEAPKFAHISPYESENVDISNLTYVERFSILLFLWAWWHQYKATEILANLRKNKSGQIITSDHKLPRGDWFEYISSPLQAAEIVMYTALTIILRYNITWFFVYAWVIVNQVETMLLSHWWYQETFRDLPKKRKAVIPFVY
ncbi:unnamed protein product [Diabrotica balteata]|uniref:Polyprenal reductase n=1 Tax=Diabrotica balteata TaxID=107213 RepID=A0A9N9T7E6_DIABA|nr:unnamed protein product [Diabrotica balteata]